MYPKLISYKEIENTKRKFVLFGAGVVAKKFITSIGSKKIKYLVDNNKSLWGTKFQDLKVKSINFFFNNINRNDKIIICSTSYDEIYKQIVSKKKNLQIFINPILQNLVELNSVEKFQSDILITSGMPPSSSSLKGGGLYKIVVNESGYKIKKIYKGVIHGLIKFQNGYIISNSTYGLIFLNKNLKVTGKIKYKINTRIHGIAYSSKFKLFYLACSLQDKILIFNQKLKFINEIKISAKFAKTGYAQHHINDICVHEDSIYVSMFSYTGNHRKNIYDGAVVEYDLHSGSEIGRIYDNLYMPHSIKFFNNSFYCLDSFTGNFLKGNRNIIGSFHGFVRGLDFKKNFFIIGQSKNRNYTLNYKENRSLDSSIIIFNEKNKIYKSIQLPSSISEIHEILCI